MTQPDDFATRLEGLIQRATKGPWRAERHGHLMEIMESSSDIPVIAWPGFDGNDRTDKDNEGNAELITYLRNNAPAIARLCRAAEKAKEAMRVWTNTYAPEMCNPDTVAESKKLIDEGGTLYYIATVNEQISDALAALNAEDKT